MHYKIKVMTNTEKLGNALALLRQSKGLTQKDVAEMIGKTQKNIWLMEKGKSFSSKSLEMYLEAVQMDKITIT